LNVGRSTVKALGKIKLQHEAGMSLAVIGGHKLQAGNLHELALQRRGYVVRHGLRGRARIIHLHLDDGIINSRQIADRQPEIS
jgi:hypothetical protein